MQIGNKIWSGAPNTVAREIPAPVAVEIRTKAVQIINDDFIPVDYIQRSDILARGGRQSEGLDANVVMAPVAWIMRTFPDAIARVERKSGDTWDWVENSEVEQLIDNPNPWYGGDALWQATCLSYVLNGNAYWHKQRNGFGQVIRLWYRPHWLIKPHSPLDGSDFIDYYEYDTGRGIVQLDPRDLVHFRFGLDPRDPRLGFAPLRTLLREVMTDLEAAQFSMKVLEKMGIPGVVVSPSLNPTGDSFEPKREEVDALKEYIDTSFTGDKRGGALVFGQPTQVSQFGFDPAQITLTEIRNTTEERVCAMLGVPAAVVGFRSGLEQTKVGATMAELVRLAWKQCLFPMQRAMARQVTAQLLTDFVTDAPVGERVKFDVSEAASLKEDASEMADRVIKLVEGGVLRVVHAQTMLGIEVDKTQEIYLRKLTVMPVTAEVPVEPTIHPQAEQVVEAGMQAEEDAANRPVVAPGSKGYEAVMERMNGNGNHAEAA
jgi:HK97 family phage portal protein